MKTYKTYASYRTSSQRQQLVNAILSIPDTPSAEAIRIVTKLAPTTAQYMRAVIIRCKKINDETSATEVANEVIESYNLHNSPRSALVFDLALAIAKLKAPSTVSTTLLPSNSSSVIDVLDIGGEKEESMNQITRHLEKLKILEEIKNLGEQLRNI